MANVVRRRYIAFIDRNSHTPQRELTWAAWTMAVLIRHPQRHSQVKFSEIVESFSDQPEDLAPVRSAVFSTLRSLIESGDVTRTMRGFYKPTPLGVSRYTLALNRVLGV